MKKQRRFLLMTQEIPKEPETIRDWLNTLQEPFRTKALRNITLGKLDEKASNLREAINRGFTWSNTPEGQLYWAQIHDQPDKYKK